MFERCENPSAASFKNYGERGIKVCERWRHFPNFIEDMGPTFFKGATLDRIENDGNYEPGNVIWSTARDQINHRGITVFVDSPWGRLPRAEAARRAGVRVGLFINRHDNGWSYERLYAPENREPRQAGARKLPT